MNSRSLARCALVFGTSGAALALALGVASLAIAQSGASPSPATQLAAGEQAYNQNCAACHGASMAGGQFAPALKGLPFQRKWGGVQLDKLYEYMRNSMPPQNTGGLPTESYAAILAMLMKQNDPAFDKSLTPDVTLLATLSVPKAVQARGPDIGIGGISSRSPLPPWPAPADPFANYKPVTQAMLNNPAPEDWLTWRRSHRGQGFSPLSQIGTGNVRSLRVAWAQSLPGGTNMNEPLVHDGVLYVYGFNDEVFALDGENGRVLWRYRRQIAQGTMLNSKKSMALYGDKLYVATSDLHLVALDARSGRPVWDKLITERPGLRNPGGPLAADGVIMQGLATQAPGGGLISGFDAETGKQLWTFTTVAAPGTPGGDTWNGLPGDKRSGASVWTSGTYDAETGLALFGTGQTYDTGPLLKRNPGQNNDGLYTDSTLALDPHTGKLVWYFQHMKNDQWDLDWVFDRVIGTLDVNGEQRRVIMTSGKEGLFDTLDAKTGRYVKTVDMGIQNFVTAIDPKTGDKTINPELLPNRDHAIHVCPNSAGGRNWTPTAFNPSTKLLFVSARDVCMDMVPSPRGFLTSGVNIESAPPKGSDGRWGLLKALDMQGGKIRWATHQRAPYTTGILTTAGGLLFIGDATGQFIAYDQVSGKELWRSGVTDVPNGSPISYSVKGKQYVALVVGHGNPLAAGLGGLTPEIVSPPINSSAVYVFALPEK
jgi:alcohol dehydrogenase (cytochrome c)